MPARRTYTVRRDRRELGPSFGIEELSLFADELSDDEILALQPAEQVTALAEIGCVLETDGHGRLCVVTDQAPAAQEAA